MRRCTVPHRVTQKHTNMRVGVRVNDREDIFSIGSICILVRVHRLEIRLLKTCAPEVLQQDWGRQCGHLSPDNMARQGRT